MTTCPPVLHGVPGSGTLPHSLNGCFVVGGEISSIYLFVMTVLRDHSLQAGDPTGVLWVDPGSAMCEVSTLPTVLPFWPRKAIFRVRDVVGEETDHRGSFWRTLSTGGDLREARSGRSVERSPGARSAEGASGRRLHMLQGSWGCR